MSVLDSTQFNQVVQEVREALLVGSQGVGEVEVATSLSNLVSLPALRLIGATETVVLAPLELLSAPAVEAAADARKATDDAIIAAVNAEAAADLSESERKDLEEIKLRTITAGTDAFAKGDKAFVGAVNAENATLYAMQIASYLQTKLEQAQVIILSGASNQDVLNSLNAKVQDSILICAKTHEEAYAAILQLRELQAQVAQAITDAYVAFDQMQLSTGESRHATELAYRATAKMEELSERTERVIVESIIQTGEAKQMVIRLEDLEKDLLFSQSAADIAATRAAANADLAKRIAEATELVRQKAIYETDRAKEAADKADKAASDAIFSAAGADSAAGHANEQAESARLASERSNVLSDNPMRITGNEWHKYDELTGEYIATGIQAKGDTGSSFRVIGNYNTYDLLLAAVPDGAGIDGAYGVGDAPPYTYYAWTLKDRIWGWHSQGELQGQRGESAYAGAVRLQGYEGTEQEYVSAPVAAMNFIAGHETSDAAHQDIRQLIVSYLSNAKGYTDARIEQLIGAAPEILDTLGELAEAILNNKSAADAIAEAITQKLGKTEAQGLYVALQDYVAYSQEEKDKLADIEERVNNFPDAPLDGKGYLRRDGLWVEQDPLPVNTILSASHSANNVFGDKWLKCDGSRVSPEDYPEMKLPFIPASPWIKATTPSFSNGDKVINIIFANGMFVGHTTNSAIWSVDGKTWVRNPLDEYIYDNNRLCYGNGMFVLLINKTNIYTSVDGKVWIKKTPVFSKYIYECYGIAYGKGKFFIVGASDSSNYLMAIASSEDAINWDVTTIGTYDFRIKTLYSFMYTDRFVIMSGNGYNYDSYTSTDGIMWLYSHHSAESLIYKTCFSNGVYSADNGRKYSYDALTWHGIYGEIPKGVVLSAGGCFVLLPTDSSGNYGFDEPIYCSIDGNSWMTIYDTKSSLSDDINPNAAAYGNGVFVIAGYSNTKIVYIDTFLHQLPDIANSYIKALK